MRYSVFWAVSGVAVIGLAVGATGAWYGWLALALAGPLALLGVWDRWQTEHSIMRLYPVSAHFRWFFEWMRPYMREYLLDSDHQGRPFNHNERALVYRRAKGIE